MPAHDERAQPPERIDLPAPTAWPMVVALGITLAFAGLVTHAAVSVVGIALALIGAVGWWREVLPEERVERIILRPVSLPLFACSGKFSRLFSHSRFDKNDACADGCRRSCTPPTWWCRAGPGWSARC